VPLDVKLDKISGYQKRRFFLRAAGTALAYEGTVPAGSTRRLERGNWGRNREEATRLGAGQKRQTAQKRTKVAKILGFLAQRGFARQEREAEGRKLVLAGFHD
jgi:hypothetical protein